MLRNEGVKREGEERRRGRERKRGKEERWGGESGREGETKRKPGQEEVRKMRAFGSEEVDDYAAEEGEGVG